jgi:hypothetical protein
MHSKKIFSAAIIAGIVLSANVKAEVLPNTGGKKTGDVRQQNREEKQEMVTQNVCENISEKIDQLENKIANQEDGVRTRQEQRLANWTEKAGKVDTKLESLREAWDTNRTEQFTKLRDRAKTDDQIRAVTAFETTTKEAIAARRLAVDDAMNKFREGVKNTIQTRQGDMDKIMSGLEATRLEIFKKAKDDCANGANAQTVRTNLRKALQEGKNKLEANKKSETKSGETIVSLVRIRQAAVEDALTKFKATMERARIELKKAFPEETTVKTENDASAKPSL